METVIGNLLFFGGIIVGIGGVILWQKGKRGWAVAGFVVAVLVAALGRGILASV